MNKTDMFSFFKNAYIFFKICNVAMATTHTSGCKSIVVWQGEGLLHACISSIKNNWSVIFRTIAISIPSGQSYVV